MREVSALNALNQGKQIRVRGVRLGVQAPLNIHGERELQGHAVSLAHPLRERALPNGRDFRLGALRA